MRSLKSPRTITTNKWPWAHICERSNDEAVAAFADDPGVTFIRRHMGSITPFRQHVCGLGGIDMRLALQEGAASRVAAIVGVELFRVAVAGGAQG